MNELLAMTRPGAGPAGEARPGVRERLLPFFQIADPFFGRRIEGGPGISRRQITD